MTASGLSHRTTAAQRERPLRAVSTISTVLLNVSVGLYGFAFVSWTPKMRRVERQAVSNDETDLAQSMGIDYTRDTVPLCEDYLVRFAL